MKFLSKKSSRGFTLIELLVVISIIALLSSVVLSSLNSARSKARDTKRISEVRQIRTALELYYNQYGYYPTYTNIGIRCNTTTGSSLNALRTGGFMNAIPVDPINNNTAPHRLCYEYTGIGNAASYSSASGLYCDGNPRTAYQYALLFSTENINYDFPRLSNSGGGLNTEYTYCVHGPLI